MIELGRIQNLKVVKMVSIGAYLNSKDDDMGDSILLPRKELESGTDVGDEIEVFVYKDSEDRLIATKRRPMLLMDEIAYLEVVDTATIGAFLDWGLEKDLFIPFKEQTCRVRTGKKYLVSLYIDKSERLCATMDIYNMLSSDSSYQEDDAVKGIIYNIKRDMGALVAIDNTYHGLIPNNELYGNYRCGDEIEARITKVREDGKLYLSLRKKAYKQMDDDSTVILDKLNARGGKLPFNDNSSPDKIKDEFRMSKRAFKRAVGRLLKEKKIQLTENGMELIDK
ncbi:S1-like domain-containing RNA-binding protein [Wukongibacter baidiensis]|uniref:CvfB family protein n=1 Tax=Wukongibacter baidiensis TaxID=1723361 RepID=UPI003D7F1A67